MSSLAMGGLFRPWAPPESSDMASELKTPPPVSTTSHNHQDSTISTTSKTDAESKSRRIERRKKKTIRDDNSISSGSSSAFRPKTPTSNQYPLHLDPHVLERLHTPSPLLGGYYTATPHDVLASEMAMEAALMHGVMPSPGQLEEYARLLQLHEHGMKGGGNRKQRPKKYRCPHCQVAFSNNGQLKGHIRIHTGERPFKCDDSSCGKTFTRNEELTRHKRIHSGLRPYACTSCGKRFGRKDHLKKHARTHQPQYHRQAMLVPFLPIPAHAYPYLYGM